MILIVLLCILFCINGEEGNETKFYYDKVIKNGGFTSDLYEEIYENYNFGEWKDKYERDNYFYFDLKNDDLKKEYKEYPSLISTINFNLCKYNISVYQSERLVETKLKYFQWEYLIKSCFKKLIKVRYYYKNELLYPIIDIKFFELSLLFIDDIIGWDFSGFKSQFGPGHLHWIRVLKRLDEVERLKVDLIKKLFKDEEKINNIKLNNLRIHPITGILYDKDVGILDNDRHYIIDFSYSEPFIWDYYKISKLQFYQEFNIIYNKICKLKNIDDFK